MVIYNPSARGFALDANSNRLEPGKKYRVSKVERSLYIVVECYNHPGGGLYWTEFKRSEGKEDE
jgi:hypothetical protein